jgi:hypothetical protein
VNGVSQALPSKPSRSLSASDLLAVAEVTGDRCPTGGTPPEESSMTPRKRKSRIYWRVQGAARRAWFDGRDYSAVGGGREPLIAPGERFATTDPDVATQLAAERLAELETARRGRAFHGGRAVETQLGAFARLHLIAKKKSGKFTDQWLESSELFLQRAVAYFGRERELDTIRVSHVRGVVRVSRGARNARRPPAQLLHHPAPSQRVIQPVPPGPGGRGRAPGL